MRNWAWKLTLSLVVRLAVDIWAVGVIMLSFLAKRHPIISLNNSSKVKNFTIANLLPLTLIFGRKKIRETAFKYGYGLLLPKEIRDDPMDLMDFIQDK